MPVQKYNFEMLVIQMVGTQIWQWACRCMRLHLQFEMAKLIIIKRNSPVLLVEEAGF